MCGPSSCPGRCLPGSLHVQATRTTLFHSSSTPHRPRAPSGGPRSALRRASPDLTNSQRTRGGLARLCGRGFLSSVHLTLYLRPPGRDFCDYRESASEFNQVRWTGSAQRSRRQIYTRISPAANLWIMWTWPRRAG